MSHSDRTRCVLCTPGKEPDPADREQEGCELPKGHREIYKKAVNLMTSKQMAAFKVAEESQETKDAYGTGGFGQGLLMARRQVETGVPFVEVGMGGWDLHNNVFNTLSTQRLPQLDQGIGALTADLAQRGMLDDVVLVWMGEFGRTPRINQNVGRDHWAASWSVMVGGGGLKGGQAVGKTDRDGIRVDGKAYLPGDIWATVSQALQIPSKTVHRSKRGRPMKLADQRTDRLTGRHWACHRSSPGSHQPGRAVMAAGRF